MIFSTQRLHVRQLTLFDAESFHDLQGNPNVMRYTGSPVNSAEEDLASLKEIIQRYSQPENDFWIWAVERKADGTFIGTCAIVKAEDPTEDEIGYRFIENHWGNGYGSEITEGLLRYGFEKMNKKELIAEVDELNIASVKILDKFMRFEKAYFNPNDQSNDRKYRLTRNEFKTRFL